MKGPKPKKLMFDSKPQPNIEKQQEQPSSSSDSGEDPPVEDTEDDLSMSDFMPMDDTPDTSEAKAGDYVLVRFEIVGKKRRIFMWGQSLLWYQRIQIKTILQRLNFSEKVAKSIARSYSPLLMMYSRDAVTCPVAFDLIHK